MIENHDALKELALDLRWSWNHSTDILWRTIDPDLWELTHNPWVVLQTVSRDKLNQVLSNPKFKQIAHSLSEKKIEQEKTETWFQENHPNALKCIAYFSMEFMLSEALPIYSGGLGNVAGDQLKAASDLGVPVIGIGLLYSQGYFRQIIDKYGNQQTIYPYNDPAQLPISPLRKADGEWLRIEISLSGCSVWIRAWEVQVGKTKLYLLDTNDAANFPIHKGITSKLYGGDLALRLKQEIVLGIGGWKLLEALKIKPDICHLNEGHAAFAILEKIHSFMEEAKVSFEVALTAVRPGILFTTHTAVPAGFDRFPFSLMKDYFHTYVESNLKIPFEHFMELGLENPDEGFFNMAHLAIRGSGAINGVSKLHGKVSRNLFQTLFPRWPETDVPVDFVTNGVHMPSWDSPEADELWTQHCGKSRWLCATEILEDKIKHIPDKEIWNMREKSRSSLVEFARKRLIMQLKMRGADPTIIASIQNFLNPKALTLTFARRFATYKRPNLLLHDPDRLLRILTNSKYPVQLILSGKAHPKDLKGQLLIQNWMKFIFNSDAARSRIVFLSDYDMLVTEHLVQGSDVWINTPRRPWEACGTSGMKVLVNGGLNLSALDGWWAEGYSPKTGWAIGDGVDGYDTLELDAMEANALYDLLEQKVIPEFYQRDQRGIPVSWISKIRESMAKLAPFYSANRSVREYTESYYIPKAQIYKKRTENRAALSHEILEWMQTIKKNWDQVEFRSLKIAKQTLEVEVFLGKLKPEWVKVELFADEDAPFKQEMKQVRSTGLSYFYSAEIPSHQSPELFTPRIVPSYPTVSVPLEISEIKWQK